MRKGLSWGLKGASLVVAVFFFASFAMANSLDFACAGTSQSSSTACTGSVALSSGNYSSSNIGVFDNSVDIGDLFTLAFDTSAGTISLTDTDESVVLSGTISSFSASASTDTVVTMVANWDTLPSAYASYLGSSTGADIGSVIYLTSDGSAQSVDVNIQPVPEPGSLMLLGTGLLGLGGVIRRKFGRF